MWFWELGTGTRPRAWERGRDMAQGSGQREGFDCGHWGQEAKLPVDLGRGRAMAVGAKGTEMDIVNANSESLDFINLFSLMASIKTMGLLHRDGNLSRVLQRLKPLDEVVM